jgi:hypothetical protein
MYESSLLSKNMYRPGMAFISTENADFGQPTEEISTSNVYMVRMLRFPGKQPMTKMQLTARCVVIALGVYCVCAALGLVHLILLPIASPMKIETAGIVLACSYLLLIPVTYFALLRDRGFSYRLAGATEFGEKLVETKNIIRALRLTAIFSGLMLLPGILQNVSYLIQLPVLLRALLFAALGHERFSDQLPRNIWDIANALNPLIHLCLAAYLIIGAPAYTRWQVRKITSQGEQR